jgi:hypothetical protein
MSESLLVAGAESVVADDNPKCVDINDAWPAIVVPLLSEGITDPANDQAGEIDCIHRNHTMISAVLLDTMLQLMSVQWAPTLDSGR